MAQKPIHAAIIADEFQRIAQWLQLALAEGRVRGLSIVLVEEVEAPDVAMPLVPRHVFFAASGASPSLAGGYLLAMTELSTAMLSANNPAPQPPSQARGVVFPMPPLTPAEQVQHEAEDHEDDPPPPSPPEPPEPPKKH